MRVQLGITYLHPHYILPISMKDANVLQVGELYLYASRIDTFTENASSVANRIAAATEHDRSEAEALMDAIEAAVDKRRRDVDYAREALADYCSRTDAENYSPEVERRLAEAVRQAEVCYERALKLCEEARDVVASVKNNLSYVLSASYGAAGRIESAGASASGVVKRGAAIIENEYKTLQV